MNTQETLECMLGSCKITATKEQIILLERYMMHTLQANIHMNLTALTDQQDFIIKNIIDCAMLAPWISSGAHVLDLGSGAGLPGIIVAILRKDVHCTLVDALEKRVAFLDNVISVLGLPNARALHLRAEEAAKQPAYREQYDFVTARAVAPLSILAELCCGFLRTGGIFAPMKAEAHQELTQAQNALATLHLTLQQTKTFALPNQSGKRTIFLFEKTQQTPLRYPRNPKQIRNHPL